MHTHKKEDLACSIQMVLEKTQEMLGKRMDLKSRVTRYYLHKACMVVMYQLFLGGRHPREVRKDRTLAAIKVLRAKVGIGCKCWTIDSRIEEVSTNDDFVGFHNFISACFVLSFRKYQETSICLKWNDSICYKPSIAIGIGQLIRSDWLWKCSTAHKRSVLGSIPEQ